MAPESRRTLGRMPKAYNERFSDQNIEHTMIANRFISPLDQLIVGVDKA